MPLPRRLRQRAACRVAGFQQGETNPDRFNEYVAGGFYQCAPTTTPGRARLFTENDTVALYYFSWLLNDCDWSPRRAGHEACLILEGLRQYPDAVNLSVIVPHLGSPHIAIPGDSAAADPHNHVSGGVSIKATRTYNVGHARALIAHGFDEEFSQAGEED
ncbi:hypothetical protein [Brevundimonas sp.]|uniref:hypothetical protein n=1 Tax=Brevundimonas sp. TaxID=1871086 RepID=UPI0035B16CE5